MDVAAAAAPRFSPGRAPSRSLACAVSARAQGFDTVLSDMLHFTSGVNDVELSLELASTALHIATG